MSLEADFAALSKAIGSYPNRIIVCKPAFLESVPAPVSGCRHLYARAYPECLAEI